MSETVLVPTDGSPLADRALAYALDHHPDAEVVVLHVIDPVDAVYVAEGRGPGAAEEWVEDAEAFGEEVCADARKAAAERGREISCETRIGKPADVILDVIGERDIDHVVVGSHGRKGLARVVLGSVSERVIERAPVPVTVMR